LTYLGIIVAAFHVFKDHYRNKGQSRPRDSCRDRAGFLLKVFRFSFHTVKIVGIFLFIVVLLFGPVSIARAREAYHREVKEALTAKPCSAGDYGPYRWGKYVRTYTVDDHCKVVKFVSIGNTNRLEIEFVAPGVPEDRPPRKGSASYEVSGKLSECTDEYLDAQKHFAAGFQFDQDKEAREQANWSNSFKHFARIARREWNESTTELSATLKAKFGKA
jgi:hypothetical protein